MGNILSLIGNGNQLNLDQTKYYAAILGESPSKGARSPVLWNAAFDGLNISAKMHPMDVATDKLSSVIEVLRNDHRFIGGAVAVPYKQELVPLLDQVEFEAEAIGVINCIYRDGDQLVGTNTDGAGALDSLVGMTGNQTLKGATALVLGIGGAGSAVSAYVASAIGKEGTLILANRTPERCSNLAGKLVGQCHLDIVDFPANHEILKKASILINCTSLGFETPRTNKKGASYLRPYTPLAYVDDSIRVTPGDQVERRYIAATSTSIKDNLNASIEALTHYKGVVFDIIYQPRQTILLNLASIFGLPSLNGEAMNLEQAVIAFHKVTSAVELSSASSESVRQLMQLQS